MPLKTDAQREPHVTVEADVGNAAANQGMPRIDSDTGSKERPPLGTWENMSLPMPLFQTSCPPKFWENKILST